MEDESAASQYLEGLRSERVLSGLQVIDLGCGRIPGFSRCAREFGAVVYTVDVMDADFAFFPEQVSSVSEIERKFHIQGDLNQESTIAAILDRAKSSDIATSAYLPQWSNNNGQMVYAPKNITGIALTLVKPIGCYFNADSGNVALKTMH